MATVVASIAERLNGWQGSWGALSWGETGARVTEGGEYVRGARRSESAAASDSTLSALHAKPKQTDAVAASAAASVKAAFTPRQAEAVSPFSSAHWEPGVTVPSGYILNQRVVGQSTFDLRPGPFGLDEVVNICTQMDLVSNADGGWNNTVYTQVDPAVGSLFAVFIKRFDNNGRSYWGLYGLPAVLNLLGESNANPYFWNGNLPTVGEWYLVVGYLHPNNYTGSGASIAGVYNLAGERVLTGTEYKLAPDSDLVRHRCYHYYNAVSPIGMEIQHATRPTIIQCHPSEAPAKIAQILSGSYEYDAMAGVSAATAGARGSRSDILTAGDLVRSLAWSAATLDAPAPALDTLTVARTARAAALESRPAADTPASAKSTSSAAQESLAAADAALPQRRAQTAIDELVAAKSTDAAQAIAHALRFEAAPASDDTTARAQIMAQVAAAGSALSASSSKLSAIGRALAGATASSGASAHTLFEALAHDLVSAAMAAAGALTTSSQVLESTLSGDAARGSGWMRGVITELTGPALDAGRAAQLARATQADQTASADTVRGQAVQRAQQVEPAAPVDAMAAMAGFGAALLADAAATAQPVGALATASVSREVAQAAAALAGHLAAHAHLTPTAAAGDSFAAASQFRSAAQALAVGIDVATAQHRGIARTLEGAGAMDYSSGEAGALGAVREQVASLAASSGLLATTASALSAAVAGDTSRALAQLRALARVVADGADSTSAGRWTEAGLAELDPVAGDTIEYSSGVWASGLAGLSAATSTQAVAQTLASLFAQAASAAVPVAAALARARLSEAGLADDAGASQAAQRAHLSTGAAASDQFGMRFEARAASIAAAVGKESPSAKQGAWARALEFTDPDEDLRGVAASRVFAVDALFALDSWGAAGVFGAGDAAIAAALDWPGASMSARTALEEIAAGLDGADGAQQAAAHALAAAASSDLASARGWVSAFSAVEALAVDHWLSVVLAHAHGRATASGVESAALHLLARVEQVATAQGAGFAYAMAASRAHNRDIASAQSWQHARGVIRADQKVDAIALDSWLGRLFSEVNGDARTLATEAVLGQSEARAKAAVSALALDVAHSVAALAAFAHDPARAQELARADRLLSLALIMEDAAAAQSSRARRDLSAPALEFAGAKVDQDVVLHALAVALAQSNAGIVVDAIPGILASAYSGALALDLVRVITLGDHADFASDRVGTGPLGGRVAATADVARIFRALRGTHRGVVQAQDRIFTWRRD